MYLDNECQTPDSVVGTIHLDGSCTDRYSSSSPSPTPSNSSTYHNLLNSMLQKESLPDYQLNPHYLHSSVLTPDGVSERCRRRTAKWMYDIVDYFMLSREVVAIALFYVDRHFTLTSFPNGEDRQQVPVTKKSFQLVALTGLHIAIKLHGASRDASPSNSLQQHQPSNQWARHKFSIQVCASISRHQFTTQAIEACEQSMLKTLDWRVNPVVPSGIIIDTLVNFLPSSFCIDGKDNATNVAVYVYDCAKYLAELSVSVPALSMVYKPSVIAYASIVYALDTCGSSYFPAHRRIEYDQVVNRASCNQFDAEKTNVQSALKILQVICTNLKELFPTPSTGPSSPISVRTVGITL